MIEEHITKKCKCGRVHNAPGNVCFICMSEAIGKPVPQRVGIAQKGDLVILESLAMQSEEDKCRTADLLARVKEETGIRFLVLNPSMRVARISESRVDAILSRIRYAGNNGDPTAVWMQKLAAHAMEPDKWPDPGEQP